MGDNNEGMKEEKQEERKDIQLVITIKGEDGQLRVAGPGDGTLYDEPLCLWMLEKAKDYIKFGNARAMQPKILSPGGRQPFYRGFRGKH